MGRKISLSELDLLPLLKRYNSSTLVTLLREIAKCKSSKLDWVALTKGTATGITNAREYQAVWRSLAYRAELASYFEDNEQPLEDESDIECELDPVPTVSVLVTENISSLVKVDLQQHDVEDIYLERDVGQNARMVLQAGDIATTTGRQEIFVPRISSGSATLAVMSSSKGSQYSANSTQGAATLGESTTAAPLSCTISTKSPYSGALSNSDRKRRRLWTPEEDLELITAVEKCGEGNWTNVLKYHYKFERTASQLSQMLFRLMTGVTAISDVKDAHSTRNFYLKWVALLHDRIMYTRVGLYLLIGTDGVSGSVVITMPDGGVMGQYISVTVIKRWALIRKRREVQERAGFKDGSGLSMSTWGSAEGRPESTQTGILPGSGSHHVSLKEDGKSGLAASAGASGDSNRLLGGVPMMVKQPLTSATGKRGVPTAPYSEAGGVSSSTALEPQRLRTSPVVGVSSSTGVSGQRLQAQNHSSVRPSGTSSSATASAAALAHNMGATAEGVHPHGPGSMVRRSGQAPPSGVASQMRHTATHPMGTTGASTDIKYVQRNIGVGSVRGGASKGPHGPDPMVQAAAMAAGARIAPASAAASLLMAAQSGKVVHIGAGGVPRSKSGLANQSGTGHTSGAIVHYIRTGSGVSSSSTAGTVTIAQRAPSHHVLRSQGSRGFGTSAGTNSAGNPNPSSTSAVSSSQGTRMPTNLQNASIQTSKLSLASKRSSTSQQKLPSPPNTVCEISTAEPAIDLDSEGTI